MSGPDSGASPLRRAAYFTYGAELLALLAIVVSFRLAAQEWDPAGFGSYVIARRTISLLQLGLLFGLAVAVPRYTALSIATPASHRAVPPGAYIVAGLCLSLLLVLPVTLLFLQMDEPMGALFFGDRSEARLAAGTTLAGAAAVLHALAYSGFRGRLEMKAASALQVVNLGIVPLAAFGFALRSPVDWLHVVAAGWLAVAAIALAVLVVRGVREGTRKAELKTAARQLIAYGTPRMPGDAALAALFAAPPVLVAHEQGLAAAGVVGVGVSLVRISGALFAPVGQVLLPAITERAVTEPTVLPRQVGRLALRVAGIALIGAALLAPFGPAVLGAYLGSEYADAGSALRWAAVAVIPFALYIVLRHVLDAIAVRAHNTRNLLLALVFFVVGWLVTRHAMGSFVAAVVALGALTTFDVRRLLRRMAAPRPHAEAVPESAR